MRNILKISFLLAILMLLSVGVNINLSAESSESEVGAKIEAMARGEYGDEFKAGNYWNLYVTSPCEAGEKYSHLSTETDKYYSVYINNELKKGIQCYGFAYAVFDTLFGGGDGDNIPCEKITYSGSGSKKNWIINNAKVGDLLCIEDSNGGKHYGIFYKYDGNYLYLYDANGYTNGGTCRISISEKRPWSDSKLKDGTAGYIYHALSYELSETPVVINDYYKLTAPDGVQTMRVSYSTSSAAILDIPAGTVVCVTKYNSNKEWGYVTYNGQSGWIRLYYVETHIHSFGSWTTLNAATCTEAGSEKHTCICGYSETRTIEALGHNYSTIWTIDTEATCTTTGSMSHHCTRCGAKTDITPIAAIGHHYGDWITTQEATCTEDGIQTRKCTVCSSTETITIPALGHSYSSVWTIDTEATCTTAGSMSHHCTRCGAKTDITPIAATGHHYGDWITIQDPTDVDDGVKLRECTVCGNTETASVPSLGVSISSLRGDIDGDGTLHAKDYMKLKRHILGTYRLNDEETSRADVDRNGTVEAKDYMMLKRVILGTFAFSGA